MKEEIINETEDLSSIPDLIDSIKEIKDNEDWSNASIYDENEEW